VSSAIWAEQEEQEEQQQEQQEGELYLRLETRKRVQARVDETDETFISTDLIPHLT